MDITSGMTFLISAVLLLAIFIVLVLSINFKSEQIRRLTGALNKMKRSFQELDQQAQLIVKTDLELNKTQEELDRRLNGLDVLQKTSRLISTTLDESEIFHRLNQSLMTELDFEKKLVLLLGENNTFQQKISLGFSEEDVQYVLNNLMKDVDLFSALKQGHTFSSVNSPKQRKEKLVHSLEVEHYVLAPILTQNGIIGIVFIGNRSNASPITQGDEELISILANQIGQSLENARLFEQVYTSRQELESKVQNRTKQLASALEEVQNISKTKSEFISAVSHELRTPLTSIKGYAAILITGKLGEIPEKVKQRLEKINMHSDNLVKLINDLLDISRIESGRVEMKLTHCDLTKIIESVHDLLTPQMSSKNIQWVTEVDPKIPEMLLDGSQVERIFINLVGNAIKFTPEEGTIRITAQIDPAENIVNASVSDTGIGIPQDSIDRLFDEFYRVDNTINQNVKGTGLGLPLAKKIVEAHNGRMWVTSEVNKGTTFHFTLPIKT